MRVLKIGRSSTNDIVISDNTVSSQHAIITVLDTKEVRIKDLNSTNGTYVNGRRIVTEVNITASDIIKVGTNTLNWVKYINEKKNPVTPTFSGDGFAIKRKKTIGRINGNDIIFNYSDVSSNHAKLIEKENGDIVIADSGSTNGTFVNGQRVNIQTLRPGDQVLIAKKYPLDWQSFFKSGEIKEKNINTSKHLKKVFVAVAMIVGVVVGLIMFWGRNLSAEDIYGKYENTVVMIFEQHCYSVNVGEFAWGNFGVFKDANGKMNIAQIPMRSCGTGFFISEDGKIVTNKHVAQPWKFETQQMTYLKQNMQAHIQGLSNMPPKEIIKYLPKNWSSQTMIAFINQIYSLPLANEVKIEGELLSIGIALNNSHVDNLNDFDRNACVFVKDAAENIDLAIIQTKSNQLPQGVNKKDIVKLDDAVTDDNHIKDGAFICSLGFPGGVSDEKSFVNYTLKAQKQEGKITQKDRTQYLFGHNILTTHGASGSPIFNNKGNLIGIINSGFDDAAGHNMAVKAKYVVELLEK